MKGALIDLTLIVAATIYSHTKSPVLALLASASMLSNVYVKTRLPFIGLFALYEVWRHEKGATIPYLDLVGALIRSKAYSEMFRPHFNKNPYESAFLGVMTSALFELSSSLPDSSAMALSTLHSLATTFLLQPFFPNKGLLTLLSVLWDGYKTYRNPFAMLFWLFDVQSFKIIPYWVIVTVGFLVGIQLISKYLNWSQIIVRKLFHFMILALFLPSHNNNEFTVFASLLASKALIVVEIIRSFSAFGFISKYYSRFIDQRDLATFARTHLYLLIGNFMPFMLGSAHKRDKSFEYLGLLSLGVGDSFASIIGSKFGKIKWPKSNKTLEGSAASLINQLAAAGFLGVINPRTVLALTAGTLYEAYTDQIDNLTLPLMCCSVYDISGIFLKLQ